MPEDRVVDQVEDREEDPQMGAVVQAAGQPGTAVSPSAQAADLSA